MGECSYCGGLAGAHRSTCAKGGPAPCGSDPAARQFDLKPKCMLCRHDAHEGKCSYVFDEGGRCSCVKMEQRDGGIAGSLKGMFPKTEASIPQTMDELKDAENPVSFSAFSTAVRVLVEGKAASKGYNQSGADGGNDLMEFTTKFFPGHAGGEIVYKAIRYSRHKQKEDLLKIAAWAYLIWRYDEESKG